MKDGWEIKKLGEVCEIQGGATPKRTEPLYWEGGTYPWFTIEDIRKQGRYINDTQQKITKLAWEKSRIFPKDTVLLCCTASIGEYALTCIPLTTNQQFNGLVIKDKSYLTPKYLMHYCSTIKQNLLMLSGKATIDFVSADKVKKLPIPIPPLPEQERIVSELDCINGILEKKREQIKELDALAQSIFYHMFGDPVTNEKGWEVRKLGDISMVKIGPFGSLLHTSDYISGGIPLVNPVHMQEEKICPDIDFTVSDEKLLELQNYILQEGDIVFARRGDIGRCALVGNAENGFLCGTGSLYVRLLHDINRTFFLKLMRSPSMIKQLNSFAKGATMLNINCKIIEDLIVPLPPLSLQQSFATKIEAIEKQKELIKRSIAEVETLLASRMQHY
ncbi:MAG: restriction endonuclease subunit S, partial [Bacteroidaceae bacterium]|nr:restriction endonuclease subunit S [Bacteroidaceae bacterium]